MLLMQVHGHMHVHSSKPATAYQLRVFGDNSKILDPRETRFMLSTGAAPCHYTLCHRLSTVQPLCCFTRSQQSCSSDILADLVPLCSQGTAWVTVWCGQVMEERAQEIAKAGTMYKTGGKRLKRLAEHPGLFPILIQVCPLPLAATHGLVKRLLDRVSHSWRMPDAYCLLQSTGACLERSTHSGALFSQQGTLHLSQQTHSTARAA